MPIIFTKKRLSEFETNNLASFKISESKTIRLYFKPPYNTKYAIPRYSMDIIFSIFEISAKVI
jgi:hypothetical protein